jgi:hypothetical protein
VRAYPHHNFTRLGALAILSVATLVGVAAWQATAEWRPEILVASAAAEQPVFESPLRQQEMLLLGLADTAYGEGTSEEDPITLISPQILAQLAGKYESLVQSGTLSEESAAAAAAEIAPNVRAYVVYTPLTATDVRTSADTSYERMLIYRTEMQKALAPLLSNTSAEYAIFASYLETGNLADLEELRRVAGNYAAASTAMKSLQVPADALDTHLAIANALARFSSTLVSLATHADDPLGSAALLRTYNDAELALVLAFDQFAKYSTDKQP